MGRAHQIAQAQRLIRCGWRQVQSGLAELQRGSRRRRIAVVRSALAVHLVTHRGLSLADAARPLGVSTSGSAKAIVRAKQS